MRGYRILYLRGGLKLDTTIVEKLKMIEGVFGIPVEIREIGFFSFEGEEIYEEIKKYWPRIKRASLLLMKKGLKIYLETPSRKFKTRGGNLSLWGTLLLYDEKGLLWAGEEVEAGSFLERLLIEGEKLLEEMSSEASKEKALRDMHTQILIRYLEEKGEELRNLAILVEYPVGAARMGIACSKLLEEESKREHSSYLEAKYARRAIEVRGFGYLLKADLVLVKNPERLRAGAIYIPSVKLIGTKSGTFLELEKLAERRELGIDAFVNPFYDPSAASQLEGKEITVVEVKGSAKTQELKNALGQVIMYSLLIALDLGTLGRRVPEIKREIVCPAGDINPLMRSVSEVLEVKITQI